jgi:hypothetical protein
MAGAGIQTAALAFWWNSRCFSDTGTTEEYDGTTWTTSPGSLNTARRTIAGTGTQTAALAFGGETNLQEVTGATEEYDGTSWTAGGSLNTARAYNRWSRNSNFKH